MKHNRLDIDKCFTNFKVLKLVSDFYSEYIQLKENSDTNSLEYLLKSKDVSVKLKEEIEKIDFLDYDLIFCAQDYTTRLTFEIFKSSEFYFEVLVEMAFGDSINTIEVKLEKIENQWLIINIEGKSDDELEIVGYDDL